MVCGGGTTDTERSCTQWSAAQGAWENLPLILKQERLGSSVWTVGQDQSLVIMGGGNSTAQMTSETVSSDGVSTKPSFDMKYRTK